MAKRCVQTLEGAALPARVRDLPDPPARLYLSGIVPRGPCVAVVGTRDPTPEALEFAQQFSHDLAARGIAILSGGAKGIDAAAHRGALAAAGATLVVAPSGFDRPYPEQHRELFDAIVAAGGGYLSCFDVGVEPRRHHFFERNALLVALCHALVLVEAPLRSGARNAAKWARQLGRPCFVVPAVPWNERGLGCIAELKRGARVLAGSRDVLAWLEQWDLFGIPPAPPSRPSAPAARASESESGPVPAPDTEGGEPGCASAESKGSGPAARGARATPSAHAADGAAGPLERAILAAIDAGDEYVEQIAERVRASPLTVNHALLLLTLQGEVEQGPCGEVTRARRSRRPRRAKPPAGS